MAATRSVPDTLRNSSTSISSICSSCTPARVVSEAERKPGIVSVRVVSTGGAGGTGRGSLFESSLQDMASSTIQDRKSTRLNSSHANISYAVFCLKKKTIKYRPVTLYSTYPHDNT